MAVETRRPEVDYLQRRRLLRAQQNVFWLQVAVDQSSPLRQRQRLEHLTDQQSRQVQRQPGKVVLRDEVVERAREQLEDDAEVFPEHEVVLHLHDVVVVHVVERVEHVQDAHFDRALIPVHPLVFEHLDGHSLVAAHLTCT